MTTRQAKVNSLLEQLIATFLRTNYYEEITGFLTVTKVDVTADLEHAKVFFSVIGQDWDEVSGFLKKHIREIQAELNRSLKMRKIPRIVFVPDRSGEHARRIAEVLKEIHDDK